MFVGFGAIDFLNSREDATLFWVVLAAIVALWKVPKIRPQTVLVLRSFLSPKLLFGIWIPASVYATIVVYLAAAAGLWHASSTKESVYWFAGTALVLAGGATQANEPAKFRQLFGRALKVTIFIEFLVNLYVFPLVVELSLRSRPVKWCTRMLSVSSSPVVYAAAAMAITSSGSSVGSASALAIDSVLM